MMKQPKTIEREKRGADSVQRPCSAKTTAYAIKLRFFGEMEVTEIIDAATLSDAVAFLLRKHIPEEGWPDFIKHEFSSKIYRPPV